MFLFASYSGGVSDFMSHGDRPNFRLGSRLSDTTFGVYMMKTQCVSSDRISSLPENIIETILSLMPIRDALRTSILSKRWRYCWMTMPKLVFDHNLVRAISGTGILLKYKLVNAIFHVLLMHNCPAIIKFELDVDKMDMETEFHPIILYLSRRTNVKDLIIDNNTSDIFYKLPTSFFLIQGLESLELMGCDLEPPLTFNGFNKLRKIDFDDVQVSTKDLQHFLSSCPLLEEVILGDYEEEYVEENSFKFVQLFQCVPLVHTLDISKDYMKYLTAGGMPNKLPTSLHLKDVRLDVCLRELDVISSVLCIIRSSPNLGRLFFVMRDNEKLPIQESSIKFADLRDDLSLTLDNLEIFEVVYFSNISCEMEFVKLIMCKSPILEIAQIELKDNVSADDELKIVRDMERFPRASPSAQLIIERRPMTEDS
ncbi:F-box/FBD/LRR-repeat protein At1g13570-like [Rutidosis leptorrhynchoides]|uniref:F-box/FBD/LRR-repeat protein At1g13570-like n=1 Tax=Rutidosis leptorrhynchoides TaxID=125765 RepID=UPI003A9A4E62